MQLQSLRARAFRNIAEVSLDAHPRLNIIVGENGAGKTNLLEAIHLAASLRVLRAIERTSDLITFGERTAQVKARFDLDGPLPVEVTITSKGKKATLADKAVRDVGDVGDRIGVVSFVPEDLTIVRGAPEVRRRALDRFCYGIDAGFRHQARRYEQTLAQRNRLLKDPAIDPVLLASFSAPLVDAGVALMRARVRGVHLWSSPFGQATAAISDGGLHAQLRYQSALLPASSSAAPPAEIDDGLAARFMAKLEAQANAERMRKTTLCGPHLDDVAITIAERRARRLASQGQARALTLALKVAQVRLMAAHRKSAPLLLLDDVAGELDRRRAAALFAVVDEVSSQAFVTTTELGTLPPLGACRIFHVQSGAVAHVEDRA